MTNEQKRYIEIGKMIAEGFEKGVQSELNAEQMERIDKRIDELLKGIPPYQKYEKYLFDGRPTLAHSNANILDAHRFFGKEQDAKIRKCTDKSAKTL